MSLGYRYVGTTDSRFESRVNGARRRLDAEYDTHELYLGLRYNF